MRKIYYLIAILLVFRLGGNAQEKAIVLKNVNVVDVIRGYSRG